MVGSAGFRDSTQIVLPRSTLEGLRTELQSEFPVTIHDEGTTARIIASPVVIKEVNDFLTRQGVSVP